MKKADLITSAILVPGDYLMLVAAGITSYGIRYHPFVTRFRPVFFDYPFYDFLPILLLISLIGIVIFALGGSYKIKGHARATEIFSKVFLGVSTLLLFVIVSFFLQRELFSSRFIIILAWIIAVLYVFILRFLIYKIKTKLFKRGIGLHQVILLGEETTIHGVEDYLNKNRKLGFKVVAKFRSFDEMTKNEIEKFKARNEVDEILDLREPDKQKSSIDLIYYCSESNITYRFIVSIFQAHANNFEMETIAGFPIIQVNRTPLDGWKRIYKRLFDILSSALLLIALSPIFIITSILIKLDSKGPILVKLERIGRGGKKFKIIKFRSMIDKAHMLKAELNEQNERYDGPLFKIQNDPRITKVGKIIRKTSVDELPQLWNVLNGSMSLVGPRPHEPEEVQKYNREYRILIGSKPGITGLAQVSGRSKLAFSEEAALDIFYIEKWSPWLDLQILIKTIFVVFKFEDAA